MSIPRVHSALPDEPGEDKVAHALIDASAGQWHLWFNLQRGAMRELDDLVIAPDIGCFCIEVKNWRLDSIREYSDDEVVTGSGTYKHPLKQAQVAQWGLRNHLAQRGIERPDEPYFYVTAALPRISRIQMYEACGDQFARQFEGMLFSEDVADPDSLTKRLFMIGEKAAINPTKRRLVPRTHQVDAVFQILNNKVTLRHRPVDPEVRKIFAKIHEASGASVSPAAPEPLASLTAEQRREAFQRPGVSARDGISRVVFHGKPGTGKTTELLKIALGHALAGRQTLVCCYNKVLASDLRVRVGELPEFAEARESLLIVDMGQLQVGVDVGLLTAGGYQTICVDEAQDFEQEHFDQLVALASTNAEWFLSDSPEQALYAGRSDFLVEAVDAAKKNSTWETTRVNLRAGIADRLVADAVLQLAPDAEKIAAWVDEHPIKTSDLEESEQGALDLEVETEARGFLPDLIVLPEVSSWWERVDDYERLLREEVVRSGDRTRLDLAVVVIRRDGTGDEVKKVKKALESLDLPYVDQIDTANRRRSLAAGEVRLCTAHSMRGVDAERVLLLDIEGMEGISEKRQPLLNIALSRARKGTRIVLRPVEAQEGSHRKFVEALVAAYSRSLA